MEKLKVFRNAISIKKILLWLMGALFLLAFWNMKLKDIARPVSHIPQVTDGRFSVTIGAIREIVVADAKADQPVDIELTLYNTNHEMVWNQLFEQVTLTGKRDSILQLSKENPLVLDKGSYYLEINEKSNILVTQVHLIEYSGNYRNYYLTLSIILLIAFALILILIDSSVLSIDKIYFLLAITLSIVFCYVMPPLSAGDEYAHFLEAYDLSNRIMHIQSKNEQGYVLLRADDYDSAIYLHDAASISDWYSTFPKGNINDMVPAREISTVSSKAWYVYLPSALMISVVRICGGSGHMLLLLGRMTNLIFTAAIIMLSIKLIPYGKTFIACLGLVPEVIYLANSFSYDGINLALCIFLVSYFYYLYRTPDQISWKKIGVYITICILMIPIKTVYVWFGALILLVPFNKAHFSKRKMCILAGLALVIIVGICVYLVPLVILLSTSGLAPSTAGNDGVSIQYILSNPKDFLVVLGNSVFPELSGFKIPERYIATSLGQILAADRYVGRDLYTLPSWMCAVVGLISVLSLEDSRNNPIEKKKRYIIAGIAGAVFFSVLIAMYFASTLINDRKIYGISGRYFLPIYALFPLVFKNRLFRIERDISKVCLGGMALINLLYLFDVFWHYSYVYFAQPVA